MSKLKAISHKLEKISKNLEQHFVAFPAVWDSIISKGKIILEKPTSFYLKQIDKILNFTDKCDTTYKSPIIYNMFVRFTTAFDHNQDGSLENIDGQFKETGTFLKAIAMLPYLKELNIEILHLLPITAIGKDGKKGDLGSPYSIYNSYKLDENLNEPMLNISVEELFIAFVEAAHLLNIKVVTEFVFRTASKDSELALAHPEWFYWIKESVAEREENLYNENNYGSPQFTQEELHKIKEKINNDDFRDLIPPHDIYINMFTETPEVVKNIDEKLIGILSNGNKIKIPSAFADWPPDDIQPAWSDVTYLKLFEHNKFNYIAYNTVRMYDDILNKNENILINLWRHIENIIPYYQNEFGIDGVMVDMGHALPKQLMKNIIDIARKNNPNFIFWEENFVPNTASKIEGYDAVLGYLPFDQHVFHKMKEFLYALQENTFPIPCFATPETHNTPRAASRKGQIEFSKMAYMINALLPLPLFIHSGFEVGENFPVNTGLGFENIDISQFTADRLPLFSTNAISWTNDNDILKSVQTINQIRSKYIDKNADIYEQNIIKVLESDEENILIFIRKTCLSDKKIIAICSYADTHKLIKINICKQKHVYDLLENREIEIKDEIFEISLAKYQYRLILA